MQGPYDASITASIAAASVALTDEVLAEADDATVQLVRFDSEVGRINAPFASILLRSESASSSQIENLTSSARAIGEAELGERVLGNAVEIVGNTRAMQAAIELADEIGDATIIEMQRVLLESTNPELTGGYRTEQVWIGGGAWSPHGAEFVPPHHERVPAAMADLVAFAQRTDIPVLVHTALVHAQFETIHPFPDGNGRTGRALVQAMLRHARVTSHVTIPLSAGLLRQRDRYFSALTAYRAGDIVPIVRVFAGAAFDAIRNGRALADDIEAARGQWQNALSRTRGSSTAHRLVDVVTEHPVLNAKLVERALSVPPKTALAALRRLEDVGILRPATSRSRNRIWIAPQIVAALDAFADRSARSRW